MALNNSSICVTSYNSGGFGLEKIEYIKSLILFSDILCIQEHFLLNAKNKKYNNTDKIKQHFGDSHDMIISPAFKSDNTVSQGRGSGGLAILWNKSLTKYVTNIKSESYRIQAIKLNFPDATLLIVNLYLINDPQNYTFDEVELLGLLTEVSRIIDSSNCCNVLLAGDMNCDFNRNTPFVNIIRQFVLDNDLNIFWSQPVHAENHVINEVAATYSCIVDGRQYTSCIDHFIGNQSVYNSVKEAGVINCPNNFSGHKPIYAKLNVKQLNLTVEAQDKAPKFCWDKANSDDKVRYKQTLRQLLTSITPPVDCENCSSMKCDRHEVAVDLYANSICEALDTAASECLPMTGQQIQHGGQKAVPGWTEYVKPYQDESLFWHGLWVAAGKPNFGDLHNMRGQSKMQYKYAVRRLKRATNNVQRDKLLNRLLDGGINIFKEIKKCRGNISTMSSSIDGKTGATDISNHFADLYADLYQKHELGAEFEAVKESINSQINPNLARDLDRVTEKTVTDALNKLKSNKSDPVFSFNSDCLLNSCEELVAHVTVLFKWFLRTGKIPAFLLLCTIIPIVKDNLGDITSKDNYRAIAIGSLMLKWFDWLIIILEGDKLTTDELQFGFQAQSSTSMCTWAIKSVVEYYNRHGRPVFACSMDLSKAFDLVSWAKLFPELLDRGVSPLVLRCLVNIYINQRCNVKWGSIKSHSFNIKNGVRQGAISSPIIFCVYLNKLIVRLRELNIGCQLDGIYLGIWVYADDIVLLCPSRMGLQSMVTLCEQFANEHSLKFSTNEDDIAKSKTKCIIFSSSVINNENICPIVLNGMQLPYVTELKHLGNTLQCNNSMSKDCSYKRAIFISKLHSLNQEFRYADPYTMLRLYDMYICDFYGSSLWDFCSSEVQKLFNSWNVAVRILFNLPRDTHRYLIEPISDVPHIKTLICSRYVQFVDSLLSCKKLSIRLLAYLSKDDHRTVLCKNLNSIASDCNGQRNLLDKKFVKQNLRFCNIEPNLAWRVPILKELIDIRSNDYDLPQFEGQDIATMINFLCSD